MGSPFDSGGPREKHTPGLLLLLVIDRRGRRTRGTHLAARNSGLAACNDQVTRHLHSQLCVMRSGLPLSGFGVHQCQYVN